MSETTSKNAIKKQFDAQIEDEKAAHNIHCPLTWQNVAVAGFLNRKPEPFDYLFE